MLGTSHVACGNDPPVCVVLEGITLVCCEDDPLPWMGGIYSPPPPCPRPPSRPPPSPLSPPSGWFEGANLGSKISYSGVFEFLHEYLLTFSQTKHNTDKDGE